MNKQVRKRRGPQKNQKKVTHRIAGGKAQQSKSDAESIGKASKRRPARKKPAVAKVASEPTIGEEISGAISGLASGNGLMYLIGGAGLLWYLSKNRPFGSMSPNPVAPGPGVETTVTTPPDLPNVEEEVVITTVEQKRAFLVEFYRKNWSPPSNQFYSLPWMVIQNQVRPEHILIMYDFGVAAINAGRWGTVSEELVEAARPIFKMYNLPMD